MNDQQTAQLGLAMIGIFTLVAILVLAFLIFLLWKIFTKAGLSGWLSLLLLVPFGPIVVLCVLAFADWKVVPVAVAPPPYYPPMMPPQPPPPPPVFQTPPQG